MRLHASIHAEATSLRVEVIVVLACIYQVFLRLLGALQCHLTLGSIGHRHLVDLSIEGFAFLLNLPEIIFKVLLFLVHALLIL
jgi:hypothetical protein